MVLGLIVSDDQENMVFCCVYKGFPFINEQNMHFLVRSHFFSHEIYEKSTFSRILSDLKSRVFNIFSICKKQNALSNIYFQDLQSLASGCAHSISVSEMRENVDLTQLYCPDVG